jgi:hypothetical protein
LERGEVGLVWEEGRLWDGMVVVTVVEVMMVVIVMLKMMVLRIQILGAVMARVLMTGVIVRVEQSFASGLL